MEEGLRGLAFAVVVWGILACVRCMQHEKCKLSKETRRCFNRISDSMHMVTDTHTQATAGYARARGCKSRSRRSRSRRRRTRKGW